MRFFLISFAALVTASLPIAAQTRVIQSPEGAGSALVETVEGYDIVDLEGARTTVDVPNGASLSAFHELFDGWIAAGTIWTDAGSELVLLRHTDGVTERLEPPRLDAAAFRIAPTPLIERGELWGVAWLEGDGGENNAVMAARWTGSAWEPFRLVSPWIGEAQLSLRGAVLDDGSALLVWAAVEAGDDEILWSHSTGEGWSPPAKLHPDNSVPDITPAVAPVAGGAIAAWSRFDGKSYRLQVARFDNGSWTETGASSEAGAFQPTPFPTAGGAGFLFQTAAPRAWSLVEVDESGRLTRRASTDRLPEQERPQVSSDGTTSLELRFVSEAEAGGAESGPPAWRRTDWIDLP